MERNLAAFLAVARAQSLTQASHILGVTQPSVTKRIANLESAFGVTLFERNRRGMILTQAGDVLLERALRIEAEYRFCHEEIRALGSAGLSVLRVGAGPLFHLSCVANLFTELKARFPELGLELITETRGDTAEALLNGEIDLYLGVLRARDSDDAIASFPVVEVEHGIVLRPDHPLAGQDRVDVEALSGHQWVIFGIDPETEGRVEAITAPGQAGAGLIDIRTTSFATGLQLVKDGPFVMSAPLQLLSRVENEGLVIKPSQQGMPKRSAGLHIRKSTLNFGVVQACLTFFEDLDFQ